MNFMRKWCVTTWIVVAVGLLGGVPSAAAEVSIVEWGDNEDEDEHSFVLSGYVRALTGASHLYWLEESDPLAAEVPEVSGLNAEVIRFQWKADVSETVTFKLHHEFFWQLAGTAGGFGASGAFGQLGLGASRRPDRTLDLQLDLIDQNGLRFVHDIDRLMADIYTETADITIGRQGITWGRSTIFPVADLWSRFSPFEIDTEQKPGIDAVRALFYPSLSSEIDVVVADRGSLEDLSGGVRGAVTVGQVDMMFGAGKFWEEIMAIAGATAVFDVYKVRLEAVLPFDIEETDLKLPRATAGFEYYNPKVVVGAEYHFNGTGAREPSAYPEQATSEEFTRGESYFLGRHYLGVYTNYTGVDKLTLSLSTIGNLTDPSLIVAPSVRYEIAQNTTAGVGAYVGVGEPPELSVPPRLNSEFGTFGNFYFVDIAAYF